MKNATRTLLRLMIADPKCREYIENGWNILFNDIMACDWRLCTNGLDKLDEVSRYALLDWYEHNDPIVKYFEEEMQQ